MFLEPYLVLKYKVALLGSVEDAGVFNKLKPSEIMIPFSPIGADVLVLLNTDEGFPNGFGKLNTDSTGLRCKESLILTSFKSTWLRL